uniref:Uncharacterized protein n=1 Tax=Panagrellus redivivus TaxID=6233 RepID=A0A7E4VNS7_PANRE
MQEKANEWCLEADQVESIRSDTTERFHSTIQSTSNIIMMAHHEITDEPFRKTPAASLAVLAKRPETVASRLKQRQYSAHRRSRGEGAFDPRNLFGSTAKPFHRFTIKSRKRRISEGKKPSIMNRCRSTWKMRGGWMEFMKGFVQVVKTMMIRMDGWMFDELVRGRGRVRGRLRRDRMCWKDG